MLFKNASSNISTLRSMFSNYDRYALFKYILIRTAIYQLSEYRKFQWLYYWKIKPWRQSFDNIYYSWQIKYLINDKRCTPSRCFFESFQSISSISNLQTMFHDNSKLQLLFGQYVYFDFTCTFCTRNSNYSSWNN